MSFPFKRYVNSPSIFVTTPFEVSFIKMVAPGSGELSEALKTIPFIRRSLCWLFVLLEDGLLSTNKI